MINPSGALWRRCKTTATPKITLDDARRVLFYKSNKCDAVKDILCTERRQWDLKHHEREKATYTKRKLKYWDHDITQIKKQRQLKIGDSFLSGDDDIPDSTPTEDHSRLTVKQLRELLKEWGLARRSLSKL